MKLEQKVTAGIEPALPLACFEAISAVPRGSKHEEKIAAFLCSFAKENGLEYYSDAANNVFIVKDATPGMEDRAPVSLQGHIDMVCEKDADCPHDFENEGLDLVVKGEKLTAKGTTLGADDGAAVAYMMAILTSNDISHPRLECLFTADEEMGMGGAKAFDYSRLSARRMINVDSEEEGIATISCAGGVRAQFNVAFERVPVRGKLLKVTLGGLAGGHSGGDIHCGRANAAVALATVLDALYEKYPFNLVSFDSGSKDNAIPRDAGAVIATVDPDESKGFILDYAKRFAARLSKADAGARFRVDKAKTAFNGMLTPRDTGHVLGVILLCPNGVLSMSQKIEGLVESSSNLGICATGASAFCATALARSCDDLIVDEIMAKCARVAKFTSCECVFRDRYPGWAYSGSSPLCDDYLRIYRETTGREGKSLAIHAGLECGLIKCAIPDLDVISIGPDIADIHTPREALDLGSFRRTWELLLELIKA